MDKVEKAEGVNREFWNAYKSHSTHAGVSLKVTEAHTANFCFLITPVTAAPTSPEHHIGPDYLIYQTPNDFIERLCGVKIFLATQPQRSP